MSLLFHPDSTLVRFFKENWNAEGVDEGYITAVFVGDISIAQALRQIDIDKEIKLAVALKLVDREWVDLLKEGVREIWRLRE